MFSCRFFVLLVLLGSLVGCAKVIVVKAPGNAPAEPDGVIYALPNTVVRVKLSVDKTEYSLARYSAYAAIFDPGGQPVCKDPLCTDEKKRTFSVQQGATFATYGEPDPDNVYVVKFSGGGAIDQTLVITWDEAGLLIGAQGQVTNRTTDVIMSSLQLAASIGTKAFAGAATAGDPNHPCDNGSSNADQDVLPILTNNGGIAANDLINNYCAMKITDRNALPHTTPQDKALLASATKDYVDRIKPLVDGKTKILTVSGNAVVMDPVNLLNTIQTQLDQQFASLYLGTKKTTTWSGVLDIRTLNAGTAIPVVRLNPEKGICIAAAEIPPDGTPLPAGFVAVTTDCDGASTVSLTLNYYPPANRQLFSRIKDDENGDRSFRYRIPAQVRAALADSTKTYGSGVFMVAQLGTIISLPATQHSKMLNYNLTFVEATGGLKSFTLGTTGSLDAATVNSLNTTGGMIVDARNAANTSSSQFTTLTREDQLLKLRDDICTIQKKYGLPCTVAP